jgi:hypothetical protein
MGKKRIKAAAKQERRRDPVWGWRHISPVKYESV